MFAATLWKVAKPICSYSLWVLRQKFSANSSQVGDLSYLPKQRIYFPIWGGKWVIPLA